MAYVIYNIRTMRQYRTKTTHTGSWTSEKLALSILRKAGLGDEWMVGTDEQYNLLNDDVEVISLMSGTPVKIKRSEWGNPAVDPSMEGYWSM